MTTLQDMLSTAGLRGAFVLVGFAALMAIRTSQRPDRGDLAVRVDNGISAFLSDCHGRNALPLAAVYVCPISVRPMRDKENRLWAR